MIVGGLLDVTSCIDNHLSQNIHAMIATSPDEWLYIPRLSEYKKRIFF